MKSVCKEGTMRRVFLLSLSCIALIGAMILPGAALAAVTADGLELSGFYVRTRMNPTRVGDTVKVSFKLKNVTGRDIRFDPRFGVFVGARWNSTTDANIRDFGHTFQGQVLKPGRAVTVDAKLILDTPGVWRFWPAYSIRGHWGPFRWNEAVIRVPGGPPPMHERGMPPMDRH
jgi:hypothetical protein